jgi:hypothetical protein
MKTEILELLNKILDSSDISRETKEKILLYYLLPKQVNITTNIDSLKDFGKAPIEKDESRVGAIHRPTKIDIDLKNNPHLKAEQEEMTETLKDIPELNEN